MGKREVLALALYGILSLSFLGSLSATAPCNSQACQACRNAGYQADDLCSFLAQRVRVRARERF